MRHKNFKQMQNVSYEELSEMLLWSELTDAQKQRVLLQSNRLTDAEQFLDEFGSFEEPKINYEPNK